MPTKPEKIVNINIRTVPVSVRSEFKAYCARHEYTLQQAIIALMRQAAEEDRVLPRRHLLGR